MKSFVVLATAFALLSPADAKSLRSVPVGRRALALKHTRRSDSSSWGSSSGAGSYGSSGSSGSYGSGSDSSSGGSGSGSGYRSNSASGYDSAGSSSAKDSKGYSGSNAKSSSYVADNTSSHDADGASSYVADSTSSYVADTTSSYVTAIAATTSSWSGDSTSSDVAAIATDPLVGGPGQIVVAPFKGDLLMVPFAMNVAAGSSANWIWGAGPHTVTQSSALEICNATQEAGAFKSGLQNATFTFEVPINQTESIFYYCGVPTHCQKAMFGIINPTAASTASASFGQFMNTMASNDTTFAQMMNETQTMCGDNADAANWGSDYDIGMLPDWALPPAMWNVMYTRQYYAANPSLLAATSSASNSTGSGSSSGSSGSYGSSASSSAASATGGVADAASSGGVASRTPSLVAAVAGGLLFLSAVL